MLKRTGPVLRRPTSRLAAAAPTVSNSVTPGGRASCPFLMSSALPLCILSLSSHPMGPCQGTGCESLAAAGVINRSYVHHALVHSSAWERKSPLSCQVERAEFFSLKSCVAFISHYISPLFIIVMCEPDYDRSGLKNFCVHRRSVSFFRPNCDDCTSVFFSFNLS